MAIRPVINLTQVQTSFWDRLKFCAGVFIIYSNNKINQSRQSDYNAVAGFFSRAAGGARATSFEGIKQIWPRRWTGIKLLRAPNWFGTRRQVYEISR
jgi:hypothetical protein